MRILIGALMLLPLLVQAKDVDFSKAVEVMPPEDLQSLLMNYASNYAIVIEEAAERMSESSEKTSQQRYKLEAFALDSATNGLLIATSDNPYIGMLDMYVMLSLQEEVVKDYWLKDGWGPEASELLKATTEGKQVLWQTVERFLSADQKAIVLADIQRIRAEFPKLVSVSWIRTTTLAQYRGQMLLDELETSGSLFSFLQLDPMANLEPATRELARSRMIAVRSIYFLERLPMLLEGQADLILKRAASMPEAQQTLQSLKQAAATANEATALLKEFSLLIPQERQAALDQLFVGLAAEREAIFSQLNESEPQLSQMMLQTCQMLQSGDSLVAQLRGLANEQDVSLNTQEYRETLKVAQSTAVEFNRALQQAQVLVESPAWGESIEALDQGVSGANNLLDQTHRRARELIILFCLGLTIALSVPAYILRKGRHLGK